MRYCYCYLLLIIFAFSCNADLKPLQEMERIKMIGDTDPIEAMDMLDSLCVSQESDYVRYKYELLKIRLKDKAEVLHISDKEIKEVVSYFGENGTDLDNQEALYYAGSVYRDLQDYPSAIGYFLNSVELAEDNFLCCDSLLLRNTYSNLSYLYNHVQDNQNYYNYALKEFLLAEQLDVLDYPNILHLAESYLLLDSIDQSLSLFDMALERQKNSDNVSIEIMSNLLYNYTFVRRIDKASECVVLIDSLGVLESMDEIGLFAYGLYHYNTHQNSRAEECYKKILEITDDLERKYNALRYLFSIYKEMGLRDKALQYGLYYAHVSDSLNLGKRQELAATVTNMYKYQRDKDEEQRIMVQNREYHDWIIRIMLSAIILFLSIFGYILIIKNRHLKKTIELSGVINKIKKDNEQLNSEIHTISEELTTKEQILAERSAQNQYIIKLLHQSELEKSSEEVITALRQSSVGKRNMTQEDWRQFYRAVDDLYPSFKDMLLQKLEKFTEEQMQVCYLMRTGFTKPQIQNLTGLSRVTVWRWDKKFDWITELLSKDLEKK